MCKHIKSRQRKVSGYRIDLMKNDHGYSFIEMIMVLAIISILTAVGLARMKSDPSETQQANAARVVMNDLRYAQEMAMTYGRPVRVDIETGLNQYSLKWDDTNEYLPSIVGTGQFIRRFGEDEFLSVNITDSDLSNNNLLYRTNGQPFSNGQQLTDNKVALKLNGKWNVVVIAETGYLSVSNQ